MIKFYFFILSIFLTTGIIAQQIDNGNMEDWDDVGSSSEEPSNWNSFMSATGGLAFFGSQQVEQSTDVSSSSTGMYSARVFSKSTLGIIANGNLTLGRINMGSSTPSSPDNYNFSSTTDGDFSQALTTMPDSLVFWVKYNANSNSDSARVRAVIHDNYDYRDPTDADSESHTVAVASLNYLPTNGWERKVIPFQYVGPSTTPAFILITFTTNNIPGGGSAGDEVFIDDVELIYNSSSELNEIEVKKWVAYHHTMGLQFSQQFDSNEFLCISNLMGQKIQSGTTEELIGIKLKSGMYIVSHQTGSSKIISE
ncbi:hypothetical protein N8Z75_00415 [Crocinitomicaceae bacterium]|nr:hypothetical protein [Crocinitomicaceae bacterium]